MNMSRRLLALPSAFVILGTVGVLLNPMNARASELQGIRRNNDGVSRFEKKPVEAYDRFTDALVDLPDSPEVHYNIGTTFLANKEFEKALNEYKLVESMARKQKGARTDEVRFRSLFNSAVTLTAMKKNDEALETYQRALEIKPGSMETKTNIELLTRSGGGGGKGDQQDKKQDKGDQDDKNKGQGQDDQQQPKQPQQFDNKKQESKPKTFDSKELSQKDVNQILEELKRQEEQIRAKMQREGAKDVPPDKDW